MTTPPSYEYPIVGGPPGFNNGGVNVLQLWSEITDSVITKVLQTITNSATTVIITFVNNLDGEISVLNNIVNAHTPVDPGAPLSTTENFGIGYGLSTIPESAQNNTILTDGNIAGLTGNSNFIAGGNSLGSTGIFVGSSMTSAVENVVIGQSTADKITTGSNNTIIGVNAGNGIETGSNNTLYGHAAEVDVENANRRIVIGAGATGTVDNGLFVPSNLAGFSGTNVDNTVVLKNSTTGQIGGLEDLSGFTGFLSTNGNGTVSWLKSEHLYTGATGSQSFNIGSTGTVQVTGIIGAADLSLTIPDNGVYNLFFNASYTIVRKPTVTIWIENSNGSTILETRNVSKTANGNAGMVLGSTITIITQSFLMSNDEITVKVSYTNPLEPLLNGQFQMIDRMLMIQRVL